MSESTQPRAGWYIDPQQSELQRYWDGNQWSDKTAPAPGSDNSIAAEAPQDDHFVAATANAAPSSAPSAAPAVEAPAETVQPTFAASAPDAPAPAAPAPAVAQQPAATQTSTTPASQSFEAPQNVVPAADGGKAPRARKIGRGTIVLIFVGAIAIAVLASILLTGGLPA